MHSGPPWHDVTAAVIVRGSLTRRACQTEATRVGRRQADMALGLCAGPAGTTLISLVSRSGDRGRAWPSGRDPVEEGRGSTGQDAEATQAGATSRTGQQRTDRRWPGSPGTGKGETVR